MVASQCFVPDMLCSFLNTSGFLHVQTCALEAIINTAFLFVRSTYSSARFFLLRISLPASMFILKRGMWWVRMGEAFDFPKDWARMLWASMRSQGGASRCTGVTGTLSSRILDKNHAHSHPIHDVGVTHVSSTPY